MKRLRLGLVLVIAVSMFATIPAGANHGFATITGIVTDGVTPIEGICVNVYDADDPWGAFWSTTTGADGSYTVDVETWVWAVRVEFQDCTPSPSYVTEWFDDQPGFWEAQVVEIVEDQTVTANAALAIGGTITGTVTDDVTGEPIWGVCVAAYLEDSDRWTNACTDGTGTYRLGPLPAGSAKVLFGGGAPIAIPVKPTPVPVDRSKRAQTTTVPGSQDGDRYIPEWWDDATYETADPVLVIAGQTATGIDAALTLGGSIHGSVTNAAGDPIANVCVSAVRGDEWLGSGYTDESGFYRVDQLETGSYQVEFSDCGDGIYRHEWYDDALNRASADLVGVTVRLDTPNIDAILALRPRPDIAVGPIEIESVPIQTDAATVPAGTLRAVTFSLENLGTGPSENLRYFVWYEMRTDGRGAILDSGELTRLGAGRRFERTVEWNSLGSLGDATIHVMACTEDDADLANDYATAKTYSVAGGTGFGFRPLGSHPFAYCDDWWDGGPVPAS